jgi:predicted AlkP superfamily pyrophosphatase or phosphodiesterase
VKKAAIILLTLFVLGCSKNKTPTKPKLVVLISVDQMRGDYLTTFDKQMEAGLLKFHKEGKSFINTHHNHAVTTTAAGHATIGTGCFPSHNGIVNNHVYDRSLGYSRYAIDDSTVNYVGIDSCTLSKVSAKKLLKPSFGDILKEKSPDSKTYSIALKDRAAILMGGHNANRAFWFDASSTTMVSTDYYNENFPKWVKTYKASEVQKSAIASGWVLDDKFKTLATTNSDSLIQEKGSFKPWFPHSLASFDTSRIRENEIGSFMWNTPFGDEFVLGFGLEIIKNQDLGTDESCDVLSIGLSAADVIGHHFGPDSYEVLDYYNKLDYYLQEFMDSVNAKVGAENVIYVLTSDHGVAPMPEVLAARGIDAKRIEREQFTNDIDSIDFLLQSEFSLTESCILKSNYNGVEPHFTYLVENGVDSIAFVSSLQKHLTELSYIDETYSFYELEGDDNSKKFMEKMKNSYSKDYGLFVKILGKENYLISMREHGTTHGTPYSYDTHVPLVFIGSGIDASQVSSKSATVDIAPTLLNLMGIESTHTFDGKVLTIY